MKPLTLDLSIYNKFNFKHAPVGVKFSTARPEGLNQIDKSLPFCEMIKEAQNRDEPFYFGVENEDCVGKVTLGMVDADIPVEAGMIGPKFGIYQEQRANNALYRHAPFLKRGMFNFVSFATLDKLTFDPDLLILMADPSQAEIINRAHGYLDGEPLESRLTTALGCSWMYIYPFTTGKVNYMVTGMTFGAKAKQIYEEGWIIFTIPYQKLPVMTKNLNEMEWDLSFYHDGRERFLEREAVIFADAAKEASSG